MPTPGAPKAAVTGILASQGDPDTDEPEWTIEDLENAKPKLVYFFVAGIDDQPMNDNYKFSRSFEMNLQDKIIEEINGNWRAKKVSLPADEDLDKVENQARIEFWSAIDTKMTTITVDDRNQLNPGPLRSLLKKYKAKSDYLVKQEIKRLEKLAKAEEETAAK